MSRSLKTVPLGRSVVATTRPSSSNVPVGQGQGRAPPGRNRFTSVPYTNSPSYTTPSTVTDLAAGGKKKQLTLTNLWSWN